MKTSICVRMVLLIGAIALLVANTDAQQFSAPTISAADRSIENVLLAYSIQESPRNPDWQDERSSRYDDRRGGRDQRRLVNCSSDDGRRKSCEIGEFKSVRLSRQISGSPCVEGRTWGTSGQSLWVDRGCRAEFEVIGGDGGWYGGGNNNNRIVRCSSNNYGREYCDIGRFRDVRLVRQISSAECRKGSTWGVERGSIWVDRGCRAEFEVIGGRGWGNGGWDRDDRDDRDDRERTIRCSSNSGGYEECVIGRHEDVRLVRQISGSECRRGRSWGTKNDVIWVDRGCRADFEVRYRR